MRWRRRRPPPPAPSAEAQEDLAQAREARETSEETLRKVCDRWPEVRAATSALREHRERNNFRAMFERALKGEGA